MAYYRTVITIEVLSAGPRPYAPYDDASISDLVAIDYDITEGGCSGMVTMGDPEEVTAERMAELLIAQGSDPSYLIPEED